MYYDIAMKTLLECAREDFFRKILKENVREFKGIEELPTETVSVRLSDFPVRVRDENGQEMIHLVEFQTDWKAEKIWSMVQYKARYAEKYKLPVKSTMVLFRQSPVAVDFLADPELHFRFRLVKMWELPAKQFMENQCLLPMIPLMDGGLEMLRETERRIYESTDPKMVDNLMIFSIFTGLRDKNLSLEIIKRRREIMVESPVYEMILEEGELKGKTAGIKEGKHDAARRMKEDGVPPNKIAIYTGLSEEEIQRL